MHVFMLFLKIISLIIYVRTRFDILAQGMNGIRSKKPKNNEFVEDGLENWVLVNQTTS